MSSTLQNRLIGTIILVALIVILLPELLDGEKTTSTQEFVNVPPIRDEVVLEPDGTLAEQTLDTNTIEEQVRMPVEVVDEEAIDDPQDKPQVTPVVGEKAQVVVQDSETQEQANTNASQTAQNETEVLNTVIEGSADELNSSLATAEPAWVIQLGSFRYKKNVDELIERLRGQGYKAFTQPVLTSAGELNKVFVGPDVDRQKLEQMLPKLNEFTKLKGKITAFEVSAQ